MYKKKTKQKIIRSDRRHLVDMLSLLLLLLVATAFAQESGDDAQDNFVDKLVKTADYNDDNFEETFEMDYGEEEDDEHEWDEKDLSLTEEDDHLEPDVSEKAEDGECPDKGTCRYHIFRRPRSFRKACRVCRSRRGYLSSIHSCNANDVLAKVLKKNISNSIYVWIGVIKRTRWSRYCNVDKSCLNYTNWARGYPKTRGRWCVALNRLSGKWVSLSCRRKLPYVCKY